MKKLLRFICLITLINSCSPSKNYSYFDENNVEIDKKDFRRGILDGKLLIKIDSTKLKLTTREKRGILNNMPKFVETLEAGLNIKIDSLIMSITRG